MNAYQQMIAGDSFPAYVLFIDLDPAQIDVNVHPTKQEIKFEDEKIVYAFIQAAVKHALAQFSITPTLEFDIDAGIQQLDAVSKPFTSMQQHAAATSSLFKTFTQKNQAHIIENNAGELKQWKNFYEELQQQPTAFEYEKLQPPSIDQLPQNDEQNTERHSLLQKRKFGFTDDTFFIQLHHTYLIAPTGNGFILINQQAAHERILYERYAAALVGMRIATQRSLFPVSFDVGPQDGILLLELLPDLEQLGYLVEPFGNNSFVIQGTPADIIAGNEQKAIEYLLEQYKHFSSEVKFSKREKLIRSIAWQHAIKPGRMLTQKEMRQIVDDLMACAQPNTTASGTPTYIEFSAAYLEKLFIR